MIKYNKNKKNLKENLCIIPARKGSKGIKNKNIVKFLGKPLVQHTFATAKKISKKFDILVSTDSKKISNLALKYNFNFLGLRPKSLSGDRVETKYVLKYEIKKFEKVLKKKYKNILVLQPTCPFRNPKKIMLSLRKLKSNTYDSVVSVEEVKTNHPFRMKIFKSKYLTNFIKQKKENTKPRQNLSKIYIRSGSIYLFKRDVLMRKNSVVGKKCFGLILEGKETINIDTKNQLNYLKFKYEK